jgi:hypothetical protein
MKSQMWYFGHKCHFIIMYNERKYYDIKIQVNSDQVQ